jgi:hypothetical protein
MASTLHKQQSLVFHAGMTDGIEGIEMNTHARTRSIYIQNRDFILLYSHLLKKWRHRFASGSDLHNEARFDVPSGALAYRRRASAF